MSISASEASQYSPRRISGMHLCISLLKDGCRWDGDVFSRQWSECLYFTADQWDKVSRTLLPYETLVHYKMDGDENGGCVWIC